jgi:hypothetical protein
MLVGSDMSPSTVDPTSASTFSDAAEALAKVSSSRLSSTVSIKLDGSLRIARSLACFKKQFQQALKVPHGAGSRSWSSIKLCTSFVQCISFWLLIDPSFISQVWRIVAQLTPIGSNEDRGLFRYWVLDVKMRQPQISGLVQVRAKFQQAASSASLMVFGHRLTDIRFGWSIPKIAADPVFWETWVPYDYLYDIISQSHEYETHMLGEVKSLLNGGTWLDRCWSLKG